MNNSSLFAHCFTLLYPRRACPTGSFLYSSPPSPDLLSAAHRGTCCPALRFLLLWKVVPLLREHKVDTQEREKATSEPESPGQEHKGPC